MQNCDFLLEMIDICKMFPGVKALDEVTLRIKKGSIHALMGENGAGKSTLMKCLFGVYRKDNGIIKLSDEEVNFSNPKEALEKGIAMVHQELNQVMQMTVADNIWLGRYPNDLGIIQKNIYYEQTVDIFKELGLNIDPYIKINKLSVSDRQMVEIAKAVSYNAKIFILDEPTSSLSEAESERLFKIMNKLKDNGCGIIYISHKMEEILAVCDEVTIMRDGKTISTHRCEDLTTEKIINLMVGRELKSRFPEKIRQSSEENILKVKGLSSEYGTQVKDVDFELNKGEILGVAGLVGSGRTELLETIFGLNNSIAGEIYLHGKMIINASPRKAIQNKFALITEERRKNGIFGGLDITFNSVISNLKAISKFGVVNKNKMNAATKWVVDNLNVKTPASSTKIKLLSGGNQQKVILGRWLLTEPEILLLDEPTRGIDVGAKLEIYQLILKLASDGKGIIVVSSEMQELLGICDRILVMSNGKVAGIEDVDGLTQERIMELSSKYV